MNAAPQPSSAIQLRAATWKVLGTSGLKRGFREVHCCGLSGLVRETLDAIEENPATEAFERMVNAHFTPLHKKVINDDPVMKKIVMAKRVTLDQIKKRMAFPTEHCPPRGCGPGRRAAFAGCGGGRVPAQPPRPRKWHPSGARHRLRVVPAGTNSHTGWYTNPRPRLDYPF